MKFNKFFLISVVLLAIVTLGAVSAASNETLDNTPLEISEDVEIQSADAGVSEDVEIQSAEVDVSEDESVGVSDGSEVIASENTDEINTTGEVLAGSVEEETLAASADDEVLSDDDVYAHDVIYPDEINNGEPINITVKYKDGITGMLAVVNSDMSEIYYYTETFSGSDFIQLTDYQLFNNDFLVYFFDLTTYHEIIDPISVYVNPGPDYTGPIVPNVKVTMPNLIGYGEVFPVSVKLPTDANGTVTVSVKGQDVTYNVMNGVCNINVTQYNPYDNEIKVKFSSSTEKYADYEKSGMFQVFINRTVNTQAYFGESLYAFVNLYDATGNVTFTLGDETHVVELVNGVASQELTKYPLRNGKINIKYDGDDKFNSLSFDEWLSINFNATYPSYQEDGVITFNVYDATGTMNFTLGNETHCVDIVDGIASQKMESLVVGYNSVTISYSGDDKFVPVTQTVRINIKDKEELNIFSVYCIEQNNNFLVVIVQNAVDISNVTVNINGRKQVVDLVDNIAIIEINASEPITEFMVSSDGNYRFNPKNSTVLDELNFVVTQDTYMYYFNQGDNGQIYSYIPEGSTLDFQRDINLKNVKFTINKPVNIVSTTEDALVQLNTLNPDRNAIFKITNGGSGTNITGINFKNTQLVVDNAHHVTFDAIKVEGTLPYGSGEGQTSIRNNSTWITVKNSNFRTIDNRGVSTLVLAWADYCTIDNNTVYSEGFTGNMIYLTTYNADIPGLVANVHNNITNNKIINPTESPFATCWAIVISGAYNLIKNNTIDYKGQGITFQWGMEFERTLCGNEIAENTVYKTSINLAALYNSIIHDNTVDGLIAAGPNSVVYNNIANDIELFATSNEYKNSVAYNNTVNALVVECEGSNIYNNTINGVLTIKSNGNTITNNNIVSAGDYTIDLTTENNVVRDNYLMADTSSGDESVKTSVNNTIEHNYPLVSPLIITVEDITVGENATVNIKTDAKANGIAQVIVNNKKYSVEIKDGEGSVEISGLNVNVYTVGVTYAGDEYVLANENTTSFTVNKIESPIIFTPGEIKVGENVTVDISIAGATGEVTVIVDSVKQVLPLTDGVATLTISNIKAGNHSITAIYMGDDKVGFVVNTTTISVEKISTIIDISDVEVSVGQAVQVKFTIADEATGIVYFDLNGQKTLENLENGAIDLELKDLAYSNYTLAISYDGDDKYAASEKTIQIIVKGFDADLKANTSDVKVGENVVIDVEINENVTGTATVTVGDEIIPVTFTNGKATVSIPNLANGTYTATVKFAGDAKFLADETTVTFTVSKEDLPENITVNMDIPEGTTSPEFSIKLPDDATGNFTVTVDGKNYTQELVNGSATVKVENLTPGNHNISSSYSGDAKYPGFASQTQNVIIPKASIPGGEDALEMTTPANSATPSYSIKLNPDATGNLTVTVDGKKTYSQALVNGSATVNVPKLDSGKHTIVVSYTGDDKYSGISKTTAVTVPAPVIKLSKNKNIKMLFSAGTAYKVLVTKDGKTLAGVKVTFKFNGKTKKVTTNKKGYATYKIPNVKPKSYKITATYSGKIVKNTVKINNIIKASNKKVKKSKKVTKIKITLKKVNKKYLKGKKLTITFNGKKYKVKTNKKGAAVWKVKKSMLKKLKVGKKYTYKVAYGKDVVSKKLTIKK